MEVVLDTSFILTCLRERIDFLRAGDFGALILPIQVIDELENLNEEKKGMEREVVSLALDIIKNNKRKFRVVNLDRKHVDAGIKRYVEGKKQKNKIIVATMDSGLKKQVKGKAKFLVVRGRKKLELVG